MMKLLKFVLLVLAVLLMVLAVFCLVLVLDWPRWVSAFLLLGIIGLVVAGLFVKKLLVRRKEQRFVQQVIEQDEAVLKKLVGKEREEHKELQDRWKESVETLRRSQLRKRGNPLYVLPWYMVIGESGSGKTTALSSARLSSPFFEANRAPALSSTLNCDWWFFEQAIVLDTAGRYAIPIDEAKDKEEWQTFLALLVKYRRREPIDGVIVTIAADKLLAGPQEALEAEGRKIRSRLEEQMRALGVSFPVYLLVTKCDLVQGMAPFAEQLPEKSLEQPLGRINQELSREVARFVEESVAGIGEKLRDYRLLLLQHAKGAPLGPAALLFPEEFENLAKGLQAFVKGAFQENPYQETPLLRGLFFSSGKQEGTPYSHFLAALGLIAEKEVLPGTSQGLFLHDFFARVLPADRGLLTPTRRALEWQSVTRNLGLVSWILVWAALCGMLGYAFLKNLAIMRDATSQFARPPEMSGRLTSDLAAMNRYRDMVLRVEQRNRHWWIPRFGLHQSSEMEAALKRKYCSTFQDRFLVSFDRRMDEGIARLTPASPEETVSNYVDHLVRRINLLTARRQGAGVEALQSRPLPAFLTPEAEQPSGAGTDKTFGPLYLSYLVWRSNPVETETEITTLQRRLQRLIDLKGGDLLWLLSWANRQENLAPVTLASFWGGSRTVAGERDIPPACTRKGKEAIDGFVSEIGKAHPDPDSWQKTLATFEGSYRQSCYGSWEAFARFFPNGAARLDGERQWQQAAVKMAGDEGPYAAFLNQAASELKPLAERGPVPPWLQQIFRYQFLNSKGGGVVAKGAEKGKQIVQGVEKLFGRKGDQSTPGDAEVRGAQAAKDYRDGIAAILPATSDRKQAFQLALQVFGEDAAAPKSPFNAAADAFARLKSALGAGKDDQAFWGVAGGPLAFLWAFDREEAACSLQSAWEEKVLQEAQGGMDQQMMQYLLGQEGPVWKFVKGPAAPFLGWSPGRGYYSREALGGSLPFEPAFFAFLSKGAKARITVPAKQKESYSVTVRGLPTDANQDAAIKPQMTRLELTCGDQVQVLENLNFDVSKLFKWSPEGCGDVLLQIRVGELTLTKRYEGPQGFPLFLRDFPGGRRTFAAAEFPAQKRALDALGIRSLRVNYQFSGERPVVGEAQAVQSLPQWAPRKILRCWD